MTQETMPDFIVIDDDPVNNMICNKMIRLAFPGAGIFTFLHAKDGMEHIVYSCTENTKPIVLLLDINMPGTNGWDVLEQFKEFPEKIRQNVGIHMLSSSICPEDRKKAVSYSFVQGYLNKPLSMAKLQSLSPTCVIG